MKLVNEVPLTNDHPAVSNIKSFSNLHTQKRGSVGRGKNESEAQNRYRTRSITSGTRTQLGPFTVSV